MLKRIVALFITLIFISQQVVFAEPILNQEPIPPQAAAPAVVQAVSAPEAAPEPNNDDQFLAGQPLQDPAQAPSIYDSHTFFPIGTSSTWNYSDGTRVQVTGSRSIGGITTTIFSNNDGTSVFMTSNASGVQMHGFSDYVSDEELVDFIFNNPLDILPAQVQVGQSFSDSTSGTVLGLSFTIHMNAQVASVEDVVTSAGVLFKDAVRITTVLSGDVDGTPIPNTVDTTWYVPGFGDIKAFGNVGDDSYFYTVNSGNVYYNSGRLRYSLLGTPDSQGFVLNEREDSFSNLLIKRQRANGTYVTLEYWPGTSKLKFRREFNADDTLVSVQEYYQDGVTEVLPEDFDRDALVGLKDLMILRNHFNLPATINEGDLNGDGTVNHADLAIFVSSYGKRETLVAPAAAPEALVQVAKPEPVTPILKNALEARRPVIKKKKRAEEAFQVRRRAIRKKK